MSEAAPLPCPFCGAEPEVRPPAKFVRCPSCNKDGRGAYAMGSSLDEAIALWNRRFVAKLENARAELMAVAKRAAQGNCIWGAPYPEVGASCAGDDICSVCTARRIVARIESEG